MVRTEPCRGAAMSDRKTPAPAPRVSVVTPAHNVEHYIEATVLSALRSGLDEIEVLVIDDGSTDNTTQVVRGIDDARVTLISIAASGGPSRPRNVGLRQARAPYVSLLDSDDLVKPGKLAGAVAALDQWPSAGFAFGDYEKMDEDGNVFETSFTWAYPVFRGLKSQPAGDLWRLISQQDLARGLIYENFIGTSGVVLRRDLALSLGGFDEALKNGDDLDLWFRLAHCGDALYCTSVGHSYRVRPVSVARGPPIRNASARLQVLRRERERWHDREARRYIDRRIAENLAVIGYQQRLQRQRWAAMRSYLHAYARSHEARWLSGLIAAAILAPGV
jgi:glycosyltransferase involved in cell wall biosynthesis